MNEKHMAKIAAHKRSLLVHPCAERMLCTQEATVQTYLGYVCEECYVRVIQRCREHAIAFALRNGMPNYYLSMKPGWHEALHWLRSHKELLDEQLDWWCYEAPRV